MVSESRNHISTANRNLVCRKSSNKHRCAYSDISIFCGAYQVIPSHGNPQMRCTLFDGYLFKYSIFAFDYW